MKTIFITIEEFIGFGRDKMHDIPMATNASYKSFPVLPVAFYIEIEVTPIYK